MTSSALIAQPVCGKCAGCLSASMPPVFWSKWVVEQRMKELIGESFDSVKRMGVPIQHDPQKGSFFYTCHYFHMLAARSSSPHERKAQPPKPPRRKLPAPRVHDLRELEWNGAEVVAP